MAEKHYIGTVLKNRMKKLGLTTHDISGEIWQPPAYIQMMLDNKLAYEDIDEFDINLLCTVLHCEPDLFTDPNYHDMISDMPDLPTKTMSKVAEVQSYIDTFAFLMSAERRAREIVMIRTMRILMYHCQKKIIYACFCSKI